MSFDSFKNVTRKNLFTNLYTFHHHHHVVLLARISLTLSRHFSLSFNASVRSSGLHPYVVFWPSTRPNMPFKSDAIGRKWPIPMASNRKKSRRWIWLTKWDKVKAHDTLIDWRTGREWPLKCMTVISAWWRSNMPLQRLSERLNYYITRWRQEVSEFGTREDRDNLCGRKPPPLGLLIELEIRWVRDKMW